VILYYNFIELVAVAVSDHLTSSFYYDSHISLSRLLEEHPDCQQVSYEEAMPTKEFSGTSPVGDKCLGVVLNCTYEEELKEARTNLRWFEASPGSTLFHIVSNA
jgi:hypothetical protein